jgi:pimeloyl-ACP methyl ester carboxylesterase
MKTVHITATLAVLALAACARLGAQQPAGGEQAVTGPVGAIYVDDGGGKEGVPVVFLHSFGGDSSHWSSQLSHVRHHRRALAIDLRGHGKSAGPKDDDYAVESFVKDVEAVVEKLELKRFVLVGHSLGGAVAIKYAGRNPRRVAGLVLVGAPGKIPPEQSQQIMGSIEANYEPTMKGYWEKLVEGAQPHVRTQILAEMDKIPRDDSIAIMKALFADDPLASLDRYSGPKLIVYTTRGNTPNDLQNVRPNVPKALLEGTSHWPHLDRPREFNAMLDEFLAKVR